MECSVEFAGIGETSIPVSLNPNATNPSLGSSLASVTSLGRYGVVQRHEGIFSGCYRASAGDLQKTTKSVQGSVARHFNDLIRRHCERVPLGWASFTQAGEKLWEGKGEKGAAGEASVGDDETQPSGAEEPKRKTVLILMSDTGGGHRASAEAIKATFELEYGDQYKVGTHFLTFSLRFCS